MSELGIECFVTAPDLKPENDSCGKRESFIIAKLKE